MGAFNEWTRATFLAQPDQRDTVTVALNLMFGAAVCTRARGLSNQGVDLPPPAGKPTPLPRARIESYCTGDAAM
jgi:trans-AT polyketide synthase/acyltransferase/oxidoreductase domain-containing protein